MHPRKEHFRSTAPQVLLPRTHGVPLKDARTVLFWTYPTWRTPDITIDDKIWNDNENTF